MEFPKSKKRLCPKCRKHTVHKIITVKKKTGSALKKGSKIRARRRGQARGKGNLGRYSRPAVTKFKMTGSKTTKKTDLRFQCNECKKMHTQRKGFRAKKLEFKQG